MNLSEKRACLQKKRGCFLCLKPGHLGKDCKSNPKCAVCAKKHSTVMCPDILCNQGKVEEKKPDVGGASSVSHGMASLSCSRDVCMQTLMLKVHGHEKVLSVRAIIDTASQRSYILKKTVDAAGLNPTGKESIIHALFGGGLSKPQELSRYEVVISNNSNDFQCTLSLLDQAHICHEIPRIQKGEWFRELRKNGIWVSDVGFDSEEISILLGADVAGRLLTGNIRQLKSGLTAVETLLGWTLLGKLNGNGSGSRSTKNACLLVSTLLAGESCISNLWKLDTLGITDSGESKTREIMEKTAQDHFLQTVKINDQGRYEVQLPWAEGHPSLPTNLRIAEKRLWYTTRKLIAENRFDGYNKVFTQWLSDDIIEVVPVEDTSSRVHYVPHRAVIKESSLTTKIRPVFDASAKEKGHPSLNECLEKGPNLIELIPSKIIKFRLKRIGVILDIRQAFLQVAVNAKDCDFLRFLWWEDYAKKKMVVYRHRRAVFGATSSRFLLAAVLKFHLSGVESSKKSTADKLSESFYVDNCVTSVDNKKELQKFITESNDIMAKGKFELRGWEHSWIDELPQDEEESPLLGMLWNKKQDVLYCDLQSLSLLDGVVTKRKILSAAHEVYDVVGYTCPVLVFPKLLLQETWKLKLGWDLELPLDIATKFLKWTKTLQLLSLIKIPRWFQGCDPEKEKWSLHAFSDASKLAFAACVYLRVETAEGVVVNLIQAKARVAPLEDLTIPRLELMSCLISSRLTASVRKSMNMEDLRTYYWTDSSTALCWIQNEGPWAIFVNNRVKEIRALSKIEEWRHVPGNFISPKPSFPRLLG